VEEALRALIRRHGIGGVEIGRRGGVGVTVDRYSSDKP
jgi:hypothetical protein